MAEIVMQRRHPPAFYDDDKISRCGYEQRIAHICHVTQWKLKWAVKRAHTLGKSVC